MTSPANTPAKALAAPSIDLDGLEAIVLRKREEAGAGAIFRTRTQALLEDNEAHAREIEKELSAQRAENARLEANITALSQILADRRVFESDLVVELAITNAAVAGLRQAGVTLPAGEGA
jgi:hypothetical protein